MKSSTSDLNLPSKIELANRVQHFSAPVKLMIQEQTKELREQNKIFIDLTNGQLPFRPPSELIAALNEQLSFLKSFQYPTIQGEPQLLKKLKNYWWQSRKLLSTKQHLFDDTQDVIVTSGAKQSLFYLFAVLLNPGDEVIFFSPFWSSFPQMVHFWQATAIMVQGLDYAGYLPDLNVLEQSITSKTKLIVLNTPNNPSGVHYPLSWMENFAKLLKKFPHLLVISDEVYHQLVYFDPVTPFFYECYPELLEQTIIVDSFSKSFASAGLRFGYTLGPKKIIGAMVTLQTHSNGGVNSLVQQALISFPFSSMEEHWVELRVQLRRKSQLLKELFSHSELSSCWYQTNGAFYFVLDLMRTPYFKQKFPKTSREEDLSSLVCEQLLEKMQVAIVPGTHFGLKNSARISLAIDDELFKEGMNRLVQFLLGDHV